MGALFLCVQARHPALQSSTVLQRFLEQNEQEWSLEMSRAAGFAGASSFIGGGGGGGSKSKLDRTLQLFRDLGHSTASLVQGSKHDEDDEDPDYLKVLSAALPHWDAM